MGFERKMICIFLFLYLNCVINNFTFKLSVLKYLKLRDESATHYNMFDDGGEITELTYYRLVGFDRKNNILTFTDICNEKCVITNKSLEVIMCIEVQESKIPETTIYGAELVYMFDD